MYFFMPSRKLLLNHLLDIGGIATLNNFYSPQAKTVQGGLLYTRKLFKSLIEDGFIEQINTIGKPANKAREVFYCLRKKGAHFIGRPDEYKYRRYGRSPTNVMHESMKFDVALSFLRLYPQAQFRFAYDKSLYNVRPDIVVKVESNNKIKYLLVEIERKKTIDRVYKEKLKSYETMFAAMVKNRSHNPANFIVLFIYTDIYFDVFARPQEYSNPKMANHINSINTLLNNLVRKYCTNLPQNRYLFAPFHDFYRLNEPVWQTSTGNRVSLIL